MAEDTDGQPAYSRQAIGRFSLELQRAEQEYQAFLDDHASPRDSSTPGDNTPSALNVQGTLADDEALIEYVVGPDSVMAFVITRRAMTAKVTPLRLVDLNARISLLRDLVQRPGDDRWLKPATRLAADLFGALDTDRSLLGIRRLYIVPHGVLNYLPFALLPVDSAQSERC